MPMPNLLPSPPPPSSGRLVAVDGTELPLVGATVDVVAGGGQARVELTQVFVNAGRSTLDVTYKVPMPADAAVSGYRFTLGDVVVEGEVHRRAEARERFEEAVLLGKTAALVEEERSALFVQRLGNLPARARMAVTLTVDQPLTWREDGCWEWRFPTVVAPRYLSDLSPPEAAALQVDVADGDLQARFTCRLRVTDERTGAASSPSHQVRSEGGALSVSGAELDRDVVLRWPVASAAPGVTAWVARPEPIPGDPDDPGSLAYVRLNLVPPRVAPKQGVARDLVVLVDVSGSMAGEPLRQARAVLDALVMGLRPEDQLELVKFSSSVEHWKKGAVAMTPENRAEACRWVEKLRAGGCTEMYTGICSALRTAPRERAQRQLLLVTDGFIGDEARIVQRVLHERPRATRVHTLGVGSAVNRTLTETVARAGGGLELVIGVGESPNEAAEMLLSRTQLPLVVDIEVSGDALVDGLPFCLPDLYAGAPATVYARVEPTGGVLELRGRGPDGAWSHTVKLSPAEPGEGEPSIPTSWARQRVADLELSELGGQPGSVIEAAITKLGLAYAIATKHTSWLAVTQAATVDGLAPRRSVEQPHAPPAHVSIEHFGLRGGAGQALDFDDGFGMQTLAFDDETLERGVRSSRALPTRVPGQAQYEPIADADDESTGSLAGYAPVHSVEERSAGGAGISLWLQVPMVLVLLITAPLWGPLVFLGWLIMRIGEWFDRD